MSNSLTSFIQLGGGIVFVELIVTVVKGINTSGKKDRYFGKHWYPLVVLLAGLVAALAVIITVNGNLIDLLTYWMSFSGASILGYETLTQWKKSKAS